MAQINTCLKRTFTIFNILFAIIGGVIITLTLLSQVLSNANGGDEVEGRTAGLIGLYIIGFATVVIAALGAYGAHKESKACLITFLVCMIIGGLLMLRGGFTLAATRPVMGSTMEERFKTLVPLDNNEENVKHMIEVLQQKAQCCGLFHYSDWRSVPESCNCNPKLYEDECQTITYSSLYGYERNDNTKTIYSQPCFPIIMRYVLLGADIGLVVFFTMAALALLGMALSSIMIHQMRYPNRSTVLLTVPTVFTAAPPKYQELQNPPAY